MDDANTCVCYRFYMVGFWLNTLASQVCPETSSCLTIEQVKLLFGKAGILIKCLFKCLAFGFPHAGNCFILFDRFKC